MQTSGQDSVAQRVFSNIALLALLLLDLTPLAGLAFCYALLYAIVALRDRDNIISAPYRLVSLWAPLLLIFVAGLPGLFLHGTDDFLKDAWYFLHPVVTLGFGYLWFRRNPRLGDLIDIYSLAGIIAAFVLFYSLYANWAKVLLLKSLDSYRLLVGRGEIVTITAVALIVISSSRGFGDSFVLSHRWWKAFTLGACLAAVAMSFSRGLLFCGLLIYLMSFSKKKLATRSVLFVILAGAAIVAAPYASVKGPSEGSFLTQFFTKVLNSESEVAVHPYQSIDQVEQNWRGFETYRAIKVFEGFDTFHQLIGGGFGQLVDLGFEQKVYDYDFVRIPVLHNGYAYVLVKTGILGEVLFVVFLIRALSPFWHTRKWPRDSLPHILGMLTLFLVALIVMTQSVTLGLYMRSGYDCVSCLMGACFAATARAATRVEEPVDGLIGHLTSA